MSEDSPLKHGWSDKSGPGRQELPLILLKTVALDLRSVEANVIFSTRDVNIAKR